MLEQLELFINNTDDAVVKVIGLLAKYALSVFDSFIILLLGWLLANYLEKLAKRTLTKVHGFDATLIGFLGQFIRYATLVIVLVMVLGQFGIQTASILAALGAVGLAIGLALQGTLQNIAAGLMLLMLRPFSVGDYISNSAVAGTVKEIDLFTSELITYDGIIIVIPNSSLWNTPITNYSRLDKRMHDFSISVSHEADVQIINKLLKECILSQTSVLDDPELILFISGLSKDSIVFSCHYWILASDYWVVSRDTIERVKNTFDEHAISILNVHSVTN